MYSDTDDLLSSQKNVLGKPFALSFEFVCINVNQSKYKSNVILLILKKLYVLRFKSLPFEVRIWISPAQSASYRFYPKLE